MNNITGKGPISREEGNPPPSEEKKPLKEEDVKTGEVRNKIEHRGGGAGGRKAPSKVRDLKHLKKEPEIKGEEKIEDEAKEGDEVENKNPLLKGIREAKLKPASERVFKERSTESPKEKPLASLAKDPLAALKEKKTRQAAEGSPQGAEKAAEKPKGSFDDELKARLERRKEKSPAKEASRASSEDVPDVKPKQKERLAPHASLPNRQERKEYNALFKEQEITSTPEEKGAFYGRLPVLSKEKRQDKHYGIKANLTKTEKEDLQLKKEEHFETEERKKKLVNPPGESGKDVTKTNPPA